MTFLLAQIFSYSILPAAMIGLYRFRKLPDTYKPFIYFTWIALMNEGVSALVSYQYYNNAINSNIYVLLEFIVLLWQFRRWNNETKTRKYTVLLVLLSSIWILDNLVFHHITDFNSLYRVCYSFVLVFLSVDEMNHLLIKERKNIWRNARFLICIAFLFYYTYKTIFEIFFVINLRTSDTFENNLFTILIFTNLFANLIYALASLWIPRRQTFTLPY